MLEKENNFYNEHKAEFHEKYLNKWLVIVGESLWGVFDKFSDAAKDALQNFESEDFMIHRPADDDMVIEIGPFISVVRPGMEEEETPEPVTIASKGEPIIFPYAH